MTKESSFILAKYKHRHGFINTQLADMFEISEKSIRKYLKGHNIHPIVSRRMEQITCGDLKAEELSNHVKKIDLNSG